VQRNGTRNGIEHAQRETHSGDGPVGHRDSFRMSRRLCGGARVTRGGRRCSVVRQVRAGQGGGSVLQAWTREVCEVWPGEGCARVLPTVPGHTGRRGTVRQVRSSQGDRCVLQAGTGDVRQVRLGKGFARVLPDQVSAVGVSPGAGSMARTRVGGDDGLDDSGA